MDSVGKGQHAWTQTPVAFPSPLSTSGGATVRELDDAERQELWSHLPGLADRDPHSTEPRFWKIAPGPDGAAWEEWKKRGIIAVGWPELGNLTTMKAADFEAVAEKCAKKHGYRRGMWQAWDFRNIRPGDRVVANQGTRFVLGVGTVIGTYEYRPGKDIVAGEDYPHQIRVRWDDTTRRAVNKAGWRQTMLSLRREDFEAIIASHSTPPPPPVEKLKPGPCEPRNVILHGPPGTGKTYSTMRRALQLILGADAVGGLTHDAVVTEFRQRQARGQIEFVTFHQSYGYEDFVEGIRPVLGQSASGDVKYELHEGVFKRIALRAAAEGLPAEPGAPTFDELWERLVRELERNDGRVVKSQLDKTYRLVANSRGNIVLRRCEVDADGVVTEERDSGQIASKENTRLYWEHREELGPEVVDFTYAKAMKLFARVKGGDGGHHCTAILLAYEQLLAMSRAPAVGRSEPADREARVQAALDRPEPSAALSFSQKTPQYVLVIDEINRGNMSKILGELITLLEPDKRLTAPNELTLSLASSRERRFGVPPNLHVLGTMNTADRSIALMDAALRRRFTFEELMPDADVIDEALSARCSVAHRRLVIELFETLNVRIRYLYDRDHQLGHAYFLGATGLDTLRRVMLDRVLPMLQEYFYGSWEKIGAVLGCPYTDGGEPARKQKHLLSADGKRYAFAIIEGERFSEREVLGYDPHSLEEKVDYRVSPALSKGTLSADALASMLLAVLNLAPDDFAKRKAELVDASSAPDPSPSRAPSLAAMTPAPPEVAPA